MQIIIDLDLREAVSDFSVKSVAPTYAGKSQDTQSLNIYFVKGGVIQDLGTGPTIKYGLIGPSGPNLLVLCTTFTRSIDVNNNVYYLGFPVFNTSNLLAALGTNTNIACISEVRYQLTSGEIEHSLDIPITIWRTILSEVTSDTTTAAFTTPAVNANVTIAIGSTSWLVPNQLLTITTAGIYSVVSITDATHFVAQNTGQTGNAASGTNIPSGSTVVNAPISALTTYPPVNQIELITTRDVASGHAGLSAATLLNPIVIPVDTQTIKINASGQISNSAILATVAANFTTPAANATVSVTLSSTASLKATQYVYIPIAGYYVVTTITDGTHAVLTNNGDPFNATSGTSITTGAVLLPAQAAAGGGGSPGQNAFTTTAANFTVPTVGTSVTVTFGSTAWMGGSGYILFISGAGYYSISSVTDSTHAIITNLGYTGNVSSGTVINSGATVSPGGLQGTASTAIGANSYDTTTASFVMPSAAASVNVTINNTGWLGLGQEVYISGAGYFSVASIVSPTVFSATNSNYPGAAAPGSTIATNAKVSPAGVIGPQGAGGAGLNAFTTLISNFIQPAVSSNVTIVVGTTAWMVAGQVIYIAGGGYYTVFSITDLTHAVVTNLGYAGNASVGATVVGSGTQGIGPAGVIGSTGASAYTTTTANFTQPAALTSVSITVGSTAFLLQNQNIFIGGAGYFSVSNIVDGTHITAINLGSPGNVTSGTVINSGAGVTIAGSTGPAVNTSGGFSTAADAISPASTGEVSEIYTQTGGVLALKKFKSGTTGSVALTDNSGTTGDILIDVPVDGSTITVTSGKLTAVGGGGGGPVFPSARLFEYDDFNEYMTTVVGPNGKLGWNCKTAGSGGTLHSNSSVGHNATDKCSGVWNFTGSTTGDYASISLGDYTAASAGQPALVPALGILQLDFRINIAVLPTGTQDLIVGLGLCANASAITSVNPNDGIYFFYWFGNSITNWRCTTIAGGTATNTSSGVAATAGSGQWHKFQILTNAGWTSIQFKIDGTLVATNTTNIPTNNLNPFMRVGNGSTGTWVHNAYIDYYDHDYQYTR